jgi:hypothetical protein
MVIYLIGTLARNIKSYRRWEARYRSSGSISEYVLLEWENGRMGESPALPFLHRFSGSWKIFTLNILHILTDM